jgi:hypothetical protein
MTADGAITLDCWHPFPAGTLLVFQDFYNIFIILKCEQALLWRRKQARNSALKGA